MRVLPLAVLFLTFISCGYQPSPQPADPLPRTGEAEAWTQVGETRTFAPENLWKYINGDAERYIRAGVQKTLTADYSYRDGTEATVDVYLMKSPAAATEIFENESSVGSEPLQIGDAGRLYGASLTFRQDHHYVRLVAYPDGPQVGDALVSLARVLEQRLGGR